jgi:hypothetical protein
MHPSFHSVTLRSAQGEPWSMDFEIDGDRPLPIRYLWCGFRVVDSPPEHVADQLYELAVQHVSERLS